MTLFLLKEIEKLPLLKGSACLIILSIQGTPDTPLCKGYKLISCAQRHSVPLPKKPLGELSSAPTLKITPPNYDFTADHTNYQNFSCLPELLLPPRIPGPAEQKGQTLPYLTLVFKDKALAGSRGIQDLLCPTFTLQSGFQQGLRNPRRIF